MNWVVTDKLAIGVALKESSRFVPGSQLYESAPMALKCEVRVEQFISFDFDATTTGASLTVTLFI